MGCYQGAEDPYVFNVHECFAVGGQGWLAHRPSDLGQELYGERERANVGEEVAPANALQPDHGAVTTQDLGSGSGGGFNVAHAVLVEDHGRSNGVLGVPCVTGGLEFCKAGSFRLQGGSFRWDGWWMWTFVVLLFGLD
jgi:hypothetical protein